MVLYTALLTLAGLGAGSALRQLVEGGRGGKRARDSVEEDGNALSASGGSDDNGEGECGCAAITGVLCHPATPRPAAQVLNSSHQLPANLPAACIPCSAAGPTSKEGSPRAASSGNERPAKKRRAAGTLSHQASCQRTSLLCAWLVFSKSHGATFQPAGRHG